MILPTKHIGEVKSLSWLNEKILRVDFDLTSKLEFTPGQFVNLLVGPNTYRSYSICSDSRKLPLSIVASVAHTGIGSDYLKALKKGDSLEMLAPCGFFALKKPFAKNLVFVATGTGIAPFISMFHELLREKFEGNVVFYFGVRNPKELFFQNVLDSFKKQFSNFDYTLCFSRECGEDPCSLGRVTKFLEVRESSHYYLCGHPEMIKDIIKLLEDQGVSKDNIFTEKFTQAVR